MGSYSFEVPLQEGCYLYCSLLFSLPPSKIKDFCHLPRQREALVRCKIAHDTLHRTVYRSVSLLVRQISICRFVLVLYYQITEKNTKTATAEQAAVAVNRLMDTCLSFVSFLPFSAEPLVLFLFSFLDLFSCPLCQLQAGGGGERQKGTAQHQLFLHFHRLSSFFKGKQEQTAVCPRFFPINRPASPSGRPSAR